MLCSVNLAGIAVSSVVFSDWVLWPFVLVSRCPTLALSCLLYAFYVSRVEDSTRTPVHLSGILCSVFYIGYKHFVQSVGEWEPILVLFSVLGDLWQCEDGKEAPISKFRSK
jgi:hypothetical protein